MGRVRLNTRIRFGDDVGEVTEFLDEPNSGLAVLKVRGRSYTVPAALIEAAVDESIELIGVERSLMEETAAPAALPGADKTIVLEFEISILASDFRYCGERCGYLTPADGLGRPAECRLFEVQLDREPPPSLGGKVWRRRRCGPCLVASPTNVHVHEDQAETSSPRALVEEQGIRICMTWNRKDLSIAEMLETFPFGEVLLAMDKVGWKWRGATPTFEQIKEKAGELLRDLDGGLGQAVTGGLGASRWGDEYTLRFPSLSEERDEERSGSGLPDPGHVGPGPCGTDGKEIDLTSAG